jgi:phosphopantothenoylcysteine decarboxylase/phosphopantothenate--cysteine ligase
VSGSIAAYKAVALASALVQQGAEVDVLMTPEATRFVQPLSFGAITHRQVVVDPFELQGGGIPHVTIGQAAAAFVVAPATAHTIARLALGLGDDAVTMTALSTVAPGVLAPGMETHMWQHQATRGHVDTLIRRGWTLVEPGVGHLASGASGPGRMAEPERIVDVLRWVLGRAGDLAGRTVVVTAGGTREPLDPVRYLSNRSSGKMGYALAQAARDRGASVVLVTTADLGRLEGVSMVAVERAEEMQSAVLDLTPRADALVMAAAVADYRPETSATNKIKKGRAAVSLRLSATADIIAEAVTQRGEASLPILVAFAAETQDLIANARDKLRRKRVDMIVANDVSLTGAGFGSDDNAASVLRADGSQLDLGLMPKLALAHAIWDEVGAALLRASGR